MGEQFWAWLAGFIDGEGSIGIRRNWQKNDKNWKTWTYKPYISIAQKDRSVLEFIKNNLKCGCIVKETRQNAVYWHYFIYSRKDILEILPIILPFTFLKKQHIETMLEYFEKCPHNKSLRELRTIYFNKFLKLNGNKGNRKQFMKFEQKLNGGVENGRRDLHGQGLLS